MRRYGKLRDDALLAQYGFLGPLHNPPRLLAVDQHDFKPGRGHAEYQTFSGVWVLGQCGGQQ